MMYRPLYWFGVGNSASLNPGLSVAQVPVYSNGGKTVTIKMKDYKWSNGESVDAQDVVFGGRALIGGVLTKGIPTTVPAGYGVYTNAQVEQASLVQLSSAVSSINNSKLFMWVIAAIIVAALVYVTALERTRDFAVLKALGSSTGLLFVGLAAQAVAVALAAAVIAAILSTFMTGIFAQPVDIPGSAFIVLPLSALVVGLLASLAALRRAASVDPAAAFAGA